MSDEMFSQLDDACRAGGASATLDALIETLSAQKQYHLLFDARLLQAKHGMGVASTRPTSFEDVPQERREEFEQSYISAARNVGDLLLADGQLTEAWIYFRTIGEPDKVTAALEALDAPREFNDQTEALINVALHEGANPVKGLEIMLRTHGTCNTITALEQQMTELSLENRKRAAALLTRELYRDLSQSLQHCVEQRMAMTPPGSTVRELIAGRDWLFEDGNYHVDVSHLNAVVRFARSLDESCPELKQAIELAEYGSHLDEPLQYGTEPPFDEYYRASIQYLRALAGEDVDAALAYFRGRLEGDLEPQDKQMVAYVLTDLLMRLQRHGEAVDVAEPYLSDAEDANGFSFSDLCRQAGRIETLQSVSKRRGDIVRYAAALIQSGT